MVTETQKQEILELVEMSKADLGSYNAVAKKCGISKTTLSNIITGKYGADESEMLRKIGTALGYSFKIVGWSIADIVNTRIVTTVLQDAKDEAMFMGIANPAGSGKTAAADYFLGLNRNQAVFKINCKEWSGRPFLMAAIRELGAKMPKGYASVDAMLESIAKAIANLSNRKPLVILDQANSLKPSALRTLIHLFNDNEDKFGLVILGTDNLETEIKRGVRLNKLGYDELDSRFGRKYIQLPGATFADTCKICTVNGITEKAQHEKIFKECQPIIYKDKEGHSYKVATDLRRLKRLVKSERLIHN
ncbi:MAG: AAA family ATPase [Bacteroidales bacterium]